jgi:hypothetical protein
MKPGAKLDEEVRKSAITVEEKYGRGQVEYQAQHTIMELSRRRRGQDSAGKEEHKSKRDLPGKQEAEPDHSHQAVAGPSVRQQPAPAELNKEVKSTQFQM